MLKKGLVVLVLFTTVPALAENKNDTGQAKAPHQEPVKVPDTSGKPPATGEKKADAIKESAKNDRRKPYVGDSGQKGPGAKEAR